MCAAIYVEVILVSLELHPSQLQVVWSEEGPLVTNKTGIDPGLKKVFEDFAKETEHLFAAWATQRTLTEKYSALQSDNKLHLHFQAEASFKWQFTKLYASHAKPVDCEEQMADDDYELSVAWAELRKKHANECFQFVCQHQERCLQVYDNAVSQTSLQLQLSDKVEAWFAEHEFSDANIKRVMLQKAVSYVESLIRLKRPSIQARMNKDKQIKQKREQALTDAMTKFESMDVKDVLSPALFELAKLGGSRKKPVTLKDDSALAFLVKDNPELREKHGKRQSILKDPHKQVRFTENDKGSTLFFATLGEGCRLRSSWQPPSDSTVDIFMRKALAWLAQHRDSIAVVDCDKGVWMAPFATFLVEQLNPLLSKLQSVVVSTDQLLEELSTVQCRPGMKFLTFDVVNLYPSVDRCHFLSVISGFLRTRMPSHSLCTFVIRALELILSACFVTFEGCKYESTDGIPTGLAVASIVANIYLWHLDCFIAEQAGELLQFIRRYVDDLLLLCRGSHQWLGEILHRWHPSLKFELSGSMEASRQVQYLDVNLGIQVEVIPVSLELHPSQLQVVWSEEGPLVTNKTALQTQVSGQQVAKEDHTHSSHEFHEPKQLLEGIDPGLKKVFEDFAKETEHLFAGAAAVVPLVSASRSSAGADEDVASGPRPRDKSLLQAHLMGLDTGTASRTIETRSEAEELRQATAKLGTGAGSLNCGEGTNKTFRLGLGRASLQARIGWWGASASVRAARWEGGAVQHGQTSSYNRAASDAYLNRSLVQRKHVLLQVHRLLETSAGICQQGKGHVPRNFREERNCGILVALDLSMLHWSAARHASCGRAVLDTTSAAACIRTTCIDKPLLQAQVMAWDASTSTCSASVIGTKRTAKLWSLLCNSCTGRRLGLQTVAVMFWRRVVNTAGPTPNLSSTRPEGTFNSGESKAIVLQASLHPTSRRLNR
ncbi:unnamed protein product [Symbiodinium sp. CCMP2592]|nr:unnamed protein product [Symbiodinium sp. CCMP2592]